MFGLFNLQVFVYYRHYPNDLWILKTLVSNSNHMSCYVKLTVQYRLLSNGTPFSLSNIKCAPEPTLNQDFGVHACHSRLPHNVHDDDIGLCNTRRIIAATLESEYSRVTRRNHHLICPSEPKKKKGTELSFDNISRLGFFCHSRPQMLKYYLRVVTLLDTVIPALCWGGWNYCLLDETADVPAERIHIQCISYDNIGHQCGSGYHYCLFSLPPPIQRTRAFIAEKVSGTHR